MRPWFAIASTQEWLKNESYLPCKRGVPWREQTKSECGCRVKLLVGKTNVPVISGTAKAVPYDIDVARASPLDCARGRQASGAYDVRRAPLQPCLDDLRPACLSRRA